MKKFLAAGLLAIAVIASSQQQAPAWVNARLGIGINAGWQSADNCWWWGAYRNGPAPGPIDYHHGHHSYFAPPVYVPYIWVGHPHAHASYPTPGPIDSFSMAPEPYANPTYGPPTYYYYYPASYYYGR